MEVIMKKILSLTLSVLLVIALLAGCGGGSGSGGCDYKYADGDCYTESRMVAKVQSNMTSRGYER